jgi:hypothetical protein
MAHKRARLFGGLATLITYEFDDAALQSELKVKVFPEKALRFLHKINTERL